MFPDSKLVWRESRVCLLNQWLLVQRLHVLSRAILVLPELFDCDFGLPSLSRVVFPDLEKPLPLYSRVKNNSSSVG